jgi:hypothetical protein
VETLNRLAFIYQCSAADLLEGEDYSYLDTAVGMPENATANAPERQGTAHADNEFAGQAPLAGGIAAGRGGAEAVDPVTTLTTARRYP